jgi:hypothetical protein
MPALVAPALALALVLLLLLLLLLHAAMASAEVAATTTAASVLLIRAPFWQAPGKSEQPTVFCVMLTMGYWSCSQPRIPKD